nr:MAG TPA: hypothetical protein [Caudoviricetes sp.]
MMGLMTYTSAKSAAAASKTANPKSVESENTEAKIVESRSV